MKSFFALKNNKNGSMLILTLIMSGLFLVTLLATIDLSMYRRKIINQKIKITQSAYVAEAGLNYYRWVLYHEEGEYCTLVI